MPSVAGRVVMRDIGHLSGLWLEGSHESIKGEYQGAIARWALLSRPGATLQKMGPERIATKLLFLKLLLI